MDIWKIELRFGFGFRVISERVGSWIRTLVLLVVSGLGTGFEFEFIKIVSLILVEDLRFDYFYRGLFILIILNL
jgi:hypothetical protein